MEEIRIVEQFEANWALLPKEKISEECLRSGETALWFCAEFGQRRFVLTLVVGKKGGVAEEIFIIDPTQKIVADRLQVADRCIHNSHFVDLQGLRELIRKDKSTAKIICRKHLEDVLGGMQKDVDWITTRLRSEERHTSESIPSVSGGLPSLGKRR